jgi:uncharacterized membrane protein
MYGRRLPSVGMSRRFGEPQSGALVVEERKQLHGAKLALLQLEHDRCIETLGNVYRSRDAHDILRYMTTFHDIESVAAAVAFIRAAASSRSEKMPWAERREVDEVADGLAKHIETEHQRDRVQSVKMLQLQTRSAGLAILTGRGPDTFELMRRHSMAKSEHALSKAVSGRVKALRSEISELLLNW